MSRLIYAHDNRRIDLGDYTPEALVEVIRRLTHPVDLDWDAWDRAYAEAYPDDYPLTEKGDQMNFEQYYEAESYYWRTMDNLGEQRALAEMMAVKPRLRRLVNLIALAEHVHTAEEAEEMLVLLQAAEDDIASIWPGKKTPTRDSIRNKFGDFAKLYDKFSSLGVL